MIRTSVSGIEWNGAMRATHRARPEPIAEAREAVPSALLSSERTTSALEGVLIRPADVLIASADRALRRRLAQSLARERGLRRLREAGDRAEIERLVPQLTPVVLLLDLPLPGYAGLESLRAIRGLSPTTRTVLLVARPDDADAVAALKQGASGYCSRRSEPGLLRRALQRVRAGEIWVGRSVTGHLLEELAALSHRRGPGAPERLRRLTAREREIVALVAAGASNKEIAQRLAIAERTVKAHLTSIFQKLGVSSRLHLAVYALEAQAPA
ncbi:MAG: DNA-binding response regulator [Candidatus Rokuibacteriota bacterium]|nr:MAG: DNA-binding response regulator [Candidatus Rokubacteria bacterium]